MSDIEKDIKRCEKLTEPQNANWIGTSNQMAIASARAMTKEQAIEIINEWNKCEELVIRENTDYDKTIYIQRKEAIETVLNMLKEKDEEIEKKDRVINEIQTLVTYMTTKIC